MSDIDREWTQERLLDHVAKWLKERPKSLAGALSALQCLTDCAEGCLSEELIAVFGDYDKFTFDYYDMSFEVHGIPEDFVCTPEQQTRFWDLGFSCFWTHVESERRMPGERHYSKPAVTKETP